MIAMDKKLQKYIYIYHRYYNLLIAQDFWQAHYQILLIILLKEFIELNVNSDIMIKNVKHVKLNISILGHHDKKCKTFKIKYKCCECFLEYTKKNSFILEKQIHYVITNHILIKRIYMLKIHLNRNINL